MQPVLFCLNGPNEVNGPNVWLTRHLPLLRSEGVAAEILYLSAEPDSPCRFRDQLIRSGVPCRRLRLRLFLEDNVEAIVAAAAEALPGFFVPNYSVPAYFAGRFLRSAGVVTIGTLHSDDPYYHDIVDYFLAGSAAWRLSAVVGVSDYLTDLVREKAGPEMPCLHAPYGVPIPSETPTPPQATFRLVYSGRLVEWQKRVRRVASAMVAAACADARVEGIFYGDGPEKAWLQAELTAVACNGRVRLGGLVPVDEIQNILKEAHAFVLLSDFEGLSIALMEAMACGVVPIVSRMRSGADDLIEDGVNGFLIDGEDRSAFIKVVQDLVDDNSLWCRMSAAARETILTREMTSAACARKWARFITTLDAEPMPRRPIKLPSQSEWDLPPRSKRPRGTRAVERRNPLPLFDAAVQAGRPVFLWGASLAGKRFVAAVGAMTENIAGFVDSDASKHGRRLVSIPIYPPSHLAQLCRQSPRPYVLITSQFVDEIESSLQKFGLHADEDYIAA